MDRLEEIKKEVFEERGHEDGGCIIMKLDSVQYLITELEKERHTLDIQGHRIVKIEDAKDDAEEELEQERISRQGFQKALIEQQRLYMELGNRKLELEAEVEKLQQELQDQKLEMEMLERMALNSHCRC